MAYTKTNWVNDNSPFITAQNLNKIEDGIKNSDSNISSVANTAAALQAKADSTSDTIDRLFNEITDAKAVANDAHSRATQAKASADAAVQEAEAAKDNSDHALSDADNAVKYARKAVNVVESLLPVDGVPSAVYSNGTLIITSGKQS